MSLSGELQLDVLSSGFLTKYYNLLLLFKH